MKINKWAYWFWVFTCASVMVAVAAGLAYLLWFPCRWMAGQYTGAGAWAVWLVWGAATLFYGVYTPLYIFWRAIYQVLRHYLLYRALTAV